jgi:signal transduction histidine kinase
LSKTINSITLKKSVLFFLLGLLFYSCNKKNEVQKKSDYKEVDNLLEKCRDLKIDKKTRLKYANRINGILNHKANDSITNDYLLKLAGRYYSIDELEVYESLSIEVYKKAVKNNNFALQAKSLSYIGDYHYYKFQNDSAYMYYSKAEKTYSTLKNKGNIDRLKLYKANILYYERDFSGCETAVVNILKTIRNKKDYRLQYDCNINLGNALVGLNNHESALKYYNDANNLVEELKQDAQYQVLKIQNNFYIGFAYQQMENYPKAIFYFEKALKLGDLKQIDAVMYANTLNSLGYAKFKLGDASGFRLLNTSLAINDSLKNVVGSISSKLYLSEYYLQQKNNPLALQLGLEAKKLAIENKIFDDELKSLELLAKIDTSKRADYDHEYIKLSDSLQNVERATRNKYARIEYETDEILHQKNTLELENGKISRQRWIILGFSFCFVVLLGLLYVTKMQHARNKELQFEREQQLANEEIYQLMLDQQNKIDEGRQKEKKRISQELHDGVMSRLTSTRLNLFILTKKTDPETIQKCLTHIAGLQDIEKEIRSISHDLVQDKFIGKASFKIIMTALIEDQNHVSDTRFSLKMDETLNYAALESVAKMNIYRICQEALQNIHKYAHAKKCKISFINLYDQLHIQIKDDGIGFDPQKSLSGIGLKNMSERVESLQGKFSIQSKIGEGTLLDFFIPI